MGCQRIRLSGVSALLAQKSWEAAEVLRIGRLEDLDVVLADSSISRCHAEVACTDQGWVVRDLGSTNGTFLNGVRLDRGEQKLRQQDRLQLGNSELVVTLFEEPSSAVGQDPKERRLLLEVVAALTQALELRDQGGSSHPQRVTDYALLLARELGLSTADCQRIQLGTPLHDIGQLSDEEGPRPSAHLSAAELEARKQQTLRGAATLATFPNLVPILPIIRSHHERWDGTGYPDGLAGEQIPLMARIVAVADAFDALTVSRFAQADLDRAFAELQDQAGDAFDPACVDAFLRLRPRIEEALQQRRLAGQTMPHLAELAYYDSLTKLPNRRLFEDRLGQALAHARRHEQRAALLFLDLDGFKRINDTLGHHVGDRILYLVGQRLKGCVRESDTVARLGGDEFTLILANIAHDQDALEVARKILRACVNPLVVADHELTLTPSIGISIFPTDGSDVESLLKRADLAMYRAKELGKNTCQLYNQSLNVLAAEHLAQKSRLQQALENDEFAIHYQPMVELGTGTVVGVESLVRWQHPELGLLSPERFLPLAEESGLIIPLGHAVLRTACAQQKLWQRQGVPPLRIAVNLSTRQFRHHALPTTLAQVLRETGLEPHSLVLEVTEQALMQSVEGSISRLRELKEMGVQLLVDGFGSGQYSFNILKRLPIDILKIDPAFVQGIPANRGDTAITTALIALAHSLDVKVIAKHVETEDQLMFLRAQQCDEMQGFLVSQPLTDDALARLVCTQETRERFTPLRLAS